MEVIKYKNFAIRNYLKNYCQKGEFLNFLKPLMRVVLLLMKSLFIPLAKSVLISLEL